MNQAIKPTPQPAFIDNRIATWQSLANDVAADTLALILDSSAERLTQINAYLNAWSAGTGREGISLGGQHTATVKPDYTLDRIIPQLTTSWGDGDTTAHLWAASPFTPSTPQASISFGINTSNPTNFSPVELTPPSEGDGLVAMTALQVATAQLCFRLWDELIASSLVESGHEAADITLNYSSATSDDGSYSSDITYSTTPTGIAADQIWLSSNWTSNADSGMVNGGYGLQTMLHEIGHSLGLSHPGVYNAAPGVTITYDTDAEFSQDNRQYTVMSYFGGYDTTANTWTQDGTSSRHKYSQTPMVYDIAAIQSLYGADMTTRTGDTIYGYNANFAAGDTEKSIFDFSTNTAPILTIWDAGGSDELDCSGWNGNQTINLTAGSYSSVCGLNNNVGIAFGTTIENATGGNGNDTLTGNSGNNLLNGGDGNDTAICGVWTTCIVTGDSVSATITDLTGINGTDIFSNIENLMFNNVSVTTAAAVNVAPVGIADNNAGDPITEAGTNVAGDSIATGNVLTNDSDANSSVGLGETKAVQKVNGQSDNVDVTVAGLYGHLILSANGNYAYTLDNANPATDALSAGRVFTDTFTYTVVDAHGTTSTATTLTVSITGSNDAPTLTAFNSTVASGNEDSEVTVTLADLQNQGNAADIDGSVDSFVIKAVSSGSLKIGSSAGTATAWNALTNNHVDAARNAYWTADTHANGILNAFTAAAKDNGGLESAAVIQATLAIAAVNDAPAFTAFSSTVAGGNEDSEVTVTLADLQSQGNATDVDGSVDSFVIKAVSNGSLKIGSSAGTATVWNAVTNNGIDAAHNAYWTAAANSNGTLNAFTATAKDNGGLESATAVQVRVAVTAVNDAPTGEIGINSPAPQQNQTLTVSSSLNDADGLGAITYSWLANGMVIGAGDSYTLTQAEVDKVITVIADYIDNQGTAENVSSTATAAVINANDIPTLTAFNSAVADGAEDSEATVTLADLQNHGNEADVDGSVDSFVIKTVSSGSLKIGVNAASATAWNTLTNNIVDAGHQAYWTPAANASGTLNAFTVTAKDNSGAESAIPAPVQVRITAVNDAPLLSTPTAINYIDTVFDDTFATVTRSLTASDIDSDRLTYGITGGTDHGLTVSKNGAYGVLTVTKTTGAYSFAANDAAIESLTATAGAGFTVSVSDSALTDSKTLTINIAQRGATESIGNNTLTGTSGNDKFDGLTGNDIINGLAGADTMKGGLGNDVYYVDNTGDVVTEAAGAGTDTVNSSIRYALGANLENLGLSGAAALNGTGNTLNNVLTGNTGVNALSAGSGNDTLIGGLGKDTLTGGLGADKFKFNAETETGIGTSTRDIIVDFNRSQGDKIDLSAIDANTALAGNNAFSAPTIGIHFSGTFAGQGRLYFDQTAHVLYGNNDADNSADFSIQLTAVNSLGATDFVL